MRFTREYSVTRVYLLIPFLREIGVWKCLPANHCRYGVYNRRAGATRKLNRTERKHVRSDARIYYGSPES